MTRFHRQHSEPESQSTQPALSDVPGGSSGVVYALRGGQAFAARLASLGITLGAQIEVVQNFGYGPVMIVVRDTRLALGRGEAAKVLVAIK